MIKEIFESSIEDADEVTRCSTFPFIRRVLQLGIPISARRNKKVGDKKI